ncbi:MAG: 4-alpha-glucanotransferase, partial [Pedobacter sp.]
VYRYYASSLPLGDDEFHEIMQLINKIPVNKKNEVGLKILNETLCELKDKNKKQLLQFYQRLMQFSGPLMAKGVEDTLMYTYNRFIGHGEVGDSPAAFGIATNEFHNLMINRQRELPLSMNATATHDTKRGEDVRARLNVLTDIPNKWRELLLALKDELKKSSAKQKLHKNDVYLVYQTLVGMLPYHKQTDDVEQRLHQYLEKALREAKKRSDWANPNETYEKAVMAFSSNLLDPKQNSYHLINNFLEGINDYSIINSLTQLLLKFTCPGIPDIYQGCELWDLSLVDPDNRRPVDYNLRSELLKKSPEFASLWQKRDSDYLKLILTQKLIEVRKKHQDLFDKGNYVPLRVKGKYSANVLAFLRQYKNQYLMIVVPLGRAKIGFNDESGETFDWEDTEIILPIEAPQGWLNLLTDEAGEKDILRDGILINEIFSEIPIALLSLQIKQTDRGSGILLPLFSLPSHTGIGNFGEEAFQFVDFLARSHQQYWQLLPLNPTTAAQHYSPYSAFSAMAGNVLYIDPNFLVERGWLKEQDLKSSISLSEDVVDYKHAEAYIKKLLKKAYQNSSFSINEPQFKKFCKTEAYWLDDFAVFTVLSEKYDNLPWQQWSDKYKFRKPEAIRQFIDQEQEKIQEIKWQQFLFHLQWEKLRNYANEKGIKLIGDLPFYVDYNAVDVWANPEVFMLNEKLEMEVVAGVPPDMFNADGQLWGLPIFNWKYLKSTNYKWWIERIKRNTELFDLIRLDHFRAFHSYWEISATEVSAKKGSWKDGPGADFLNKLFTVFDDHRFIVEDLGSDMAGPTKLREDFKLAGMKVLQFAFGSDMASSVHAPHNFTNFNTVVYTGTHDNNTIKGWYLDEISDNERKRLELYLGQRVNVDSVSQNLMELALKSTAKIAI